MDSAIWPWLTSILAVVSIGLATLLIIERERKRSTDRDREAALSSRLPVIPFTAKRTVSPDVYEEAKDRLRVLDLELSLIHI